MNINDIFGPLTAITDWIETVLINGLLGQGFRVILDAVNAYLQIKPLLDFLGALSGLFVA